MIRSQLVDQRLIVQEHDRVQRLVLTRGATAAGDGQMREERRQLGSAQLGGGSPASVRRAMKRKKIPDPPAITVNSGLGQMFALTHGRESVEQLHGANVSI